VNTKEFIQKAKLKHGDKYNYSKVIYIGTYNLIEIICDKHGSFMQRPNNHLTGSGCKECTKGRKRFGIDKFIMKAKNIHGDRYDYSKSIYVNADTRLIIICKDHGEFTQTPSKHLSGRGCGQCATIKNAKNMSLTTDKFIEKAKVVHGDKYDYSLVEYKNSQTKVKIICPKHGVFEQRPLNHLKPKNCPKCMTRTNTPWTTEDAIKNAIKKHGNKYDYSKFEYINADTKSTVICPHHGEFQTSPRIHINMGSGCPSCNESSGEKEVARLLTEKGVEFKRQKRWTKCRDKNPLPFDFYIPSLNLAIEYDGEQHFIPKNCWGGGEEFDKIKRRDALKNKFCEENNIPLLRINYTENIEEKLSLL